jgi:uncharacterized SAM-binding protein YcdF (DUF218 family)
MELLIVKILSALVLPPGGNIVLAVAALALWRRLRLLAVILMSISLVTLYAFSTPRLSDLLFESVESFHPRLPGAALAKNVGAIVVLAGGRNTNAPEYGGETVSYPSLVRLRYAARLQRETGLPLLVSGGRVYEIAVTSESALIKDVLETELNARVRWLEEQSRTTAENASYSAELLRNEKITAIVLVTDASHMSRAVKAFENQGMEVHAAPTGHRGGQGGHAGVIDWLPSSKALDKSRIALHELLGRVWYAVRY